MNFDAFINEINENSWDVHGVEVYENNNLVNEYGITRNIRYPIYSATKTITSIAVGMAVDSNKMNIEESVLKYMPEEIVGALPDKQLKLFQKVSLKRLLTMSVKGFPFRPEGGSWLYNSLSYPITPDVCEFDYSNVSAYLVGVAVENAIGEDVYQFLNRRLFEPLEIENPPCKRCPDGHFYGATGMELSVNELSRIGLVLMNNGIYNGIRIVSESYVRDACRLQQVNREGGYGYFIWKYGSGYSINGKWGQKCYIIPSKDMIITFLCNMKNNAYQLTDCIQKYLK